MSVEGTPLRRFGRYLVTQPRRGAHAFWRVYDRETDEAILYSEHRASADEGARRLATGRPIYTPAEMLARYVALYASLFPSRALYFDHVYLTNGNRLDWINGGLADANVTALTDEGTAMLAAREARRRAEQKERMNSDAFTRVSDEADREIAAEENAIRAQFAAGTWPDSIGETRLYPAAHGSLYELIALPSPAPEWVDDARAATRLLLTHGRNSRDGDNTLAIVREWAAALAVRFGGQWLPDEAI